MRCDRFELPQDSTAVDISTRWVWEGLGVVETHVFNLGDWRDV